MKVNWKEKLAGLRTSLPNYRDLPKDERAALRQKKYATAKRWGL